MAARADGRVFGAYRLFEPIGKGGMAVVYRAVLEGNDGVRHDRVVKRIRPGLSRDREFRRMLLDEARLASRLHHPAIVSVLDVGEVDGEVFLAMDLVDGVDLARLLRARAGEPLPIGVACYIAAELAGALAYAHSLADDDGHPLGIVHRDVSPSNVVIAKTGAVKLLDFGIAKASGRIRDEQTRTGVVKGKTAYLSPEQADGFDLDHRSDIFALGIVFYECLTGQRLFRGANDLATLRLIREADVAPPSSVRAEIVPELDALVLRMMARRREDRPQSCKEVRTALQPLLRHYDADAMVVSRFLEECGTSQPWEDNSVAPTVVLPERGERITVSEEHDAPVVVEAPRRTRRWIIAAAVVACIAGAGVVYATRDRTAPPDGAATFSPPALPTAPPDAAVIVASPPAPDAAVVVAPAAPIETKVVIASNPPGAKILIDGKPRGVTPKVVSLRLPSALRLERRGYEPALTVVRTADDVRLKLVRRRNSSRPPRRTEPLD